VPVAEFEVQLLLLDLNRNCSNLPIPHNLSLNLVFDLSF
jgi:hypothetical protein